MDYAKQAKAAVNKAIKSAKTTVTDIDAALRASCSNAAIHGDVEQLNRLISNPDIDKAVHGNGHRMFANQFEFLTFDTKTKRFKVSKAFKLANKSDGAEQIKDVWLSDVAAAPIYTSLEAPKAEFKGFDLSKQIAALIKKAEKVAEMHADGEIDEDMWTNKVNMRGLEQLRKIAA